MSKKKEIDYFATTNLVAIFEKKYKYRLARILKSI